MVNKKEKEVKDYIKLYMLRIFKGNSVVSFADEKAFIDKLIDSFDELKLGSADDILGVHFLLQDKVTKFLAEFPYLIEKYRYTTDYESIETKGEIRGAIDWNKTFQSRGNGEANGRNKYVYISAKRSDFTKENHVLYKLIEVLFDIINTSNLLDSLEEEEWFEKTKDAIEATRSVIAKHAFLSGVHNLLVDDLTINKVSKSKNELYSRSAEILRDYIEVKNGSKRGIAKILADTFVDNCDDNTCFELYWIFRIINENAKIEDVDFKTVLPNQNILARWVHGKKTHVFYHNCNSTQNVSFDVLDSDLVYDKKLKYDYHTLDALHRFNEYRKRLTGNSKDRHEIFNGRPDFLIEISCNNYLERVVIGEVKNTFEINYALRGLFELVQYMEYIGETGKGLGTIDTKKVKIHGIICSHVNRSQHISDAITWRFFGDDSITVL